MATRELPLHPRPYVESCYGYAERTPGLLARTELPGPRAVLILELGEPIRVHDGGEVRRFAGGFVAGLDDRPTVTEHDGAQRGVQLSLTPQGARRLFGVPMSALTRRVVALDDLWPGLHLADRLRACTSWDQRFDLVEAVLSARLAGAAPERPEIVHAVGRIAASGGALRMDALARELGYSSRHLGALFKDQVGMPPKLLARLVRFDRLVAELRRPARARSWAELSARLGYADQAHLARDVRALAGMTPTALCASIVDPFTPEREAAAS